MKKASGFEKFFKSKEKSGAAKKEEIRKEKRQFRKEREEKIAAHKRQKRAAAKNAGPQAPKYNLEPPASRFSPKKDERKTNRPGLSIEKKGTGAGQKFRAERTDKPFAPKKREDNRDKSFRDKSGQRPERPFVQNRKEEKSERKPFEKRKPQNERAFGRPQKESGRNTEKRSFQSKPQQHVEAKPQPVVQSKGTLTDLMPLNKYIAHSGVCSRRDAVDLIKGGKVKVNGELILEPGHKVLLSDEVKAAGKRLNPVKDFVYILLNKPKDYITTTEDPQERKTVLDLLKNAPPARIYPVGRLDRNTSGVLLLTNDGDLSQKLTHPSNEIKKVYAVTLDKPLTRHHFDEILKGVLLEDGPANVDVLAYTDAKDHTQLGVELHSGRNRIVRRIFEHFGYDVKALDRVVFAGLTKKNVNRGKWRFLTEKEVRDLKFFRKGKS